VHDLRQFIARYQLVNNTTVCPLVLAESTDNVIAFALPQYRNQHPAFDKGIEPPIQFAASQIVIVREYLRSQIRRIAAHHTVVIGMRPCPDEQQACLHGQFSHFLVCPEIRFYRPRPCHDSCFFAGIVKPCLTAMGSAGMQQPVPP
jgi:hypothetical protein